MERKPAPSVKTVSKNALGETTEIYWRLSDWFKDLGAEKLKQLGTYHGELIKFNVSLNLISVKTISQADSIHFADSIIAAKHIRPLISGNEVYDFGSGNGFPGLVMGILYPELKMKLVDADQRKSEFLKHMVSKLNIQNVEILNTQVEKLPEKSVQFGVCRGFSSLAKSTLILRKIFKKGGIFFHLKSEEWFSEVSNMPTQLCAFWKPGLVSEYRLPSGEVSYAVVKTEKIAD